MTLPLPGRLVASVRADPERGQWLADLPGTVHALARRWSLTLGAPFQPGGEVSWVAPARDPAGRDLVLKVGWWHPEAAQEAAGLRAWRDRGAVRLHAEHRLGRSAGLLLARARPGTALTYRPEAEQDEVIADLLRELWHEPPAGHPFPSLAELCDTWAAEFEQDYAAHPEILDAGLARTGMELFRGLARDRAPQRLLATDLHAGNVLAASAGRPWLVIDPKPHVGDPTYDVLQHLLNCDRRLAADPGGLADRMAALLDLDRQRLRHWLFARCVQESVEQPWLRPVATALRP